MDNRHGDWKGRNAQVQNEQLGRSQLLLASCDPLTVLSTISPGFRSTAFGDIKKNWHGKNQSITVWTSYGHCSKMARHLMPLAKNTDKFQRDRINLGGLQATCQQLASNLPATHIPRLCRVFLILINLSYHTYIYSHPKIDGQVNHH